MNKLTASLAALALFAALPGQAAQQLDPAKSEIRFVARQMNVPAEGRFRKFSANVNFDPARLAQSSVTVDIDIASIDLGSAENEAELKKKSWFNSAGFPSARFSASNFKSKGGNQYEVSGKLSIKGISRDVTAPFTVQQNGAQLTVSGSVPLKRLAFNVGEGEWADTETVADEVLVKFRLNLVNTSTAAKK